MTTYPNVPDAPGVPPVNRDPNAQPPQTPPALTSDSVPNGMQGPQWGIFDSSSGKEVLGADSIFGWRYNTESKLLSYPVEGGGFEDYNKVLIPFEGVVTATKGGTISEKNAFLSNLESLKAGLGLFTVMTPEFQYLSANIKAYRLDRSPDRGARLLTVEIFVEQVNETVTANFTSTKNSASQDPTQSGSVQAKAPTPAQASAGAPT